MTSSTERGRAREVTLSCSSNSGYDVEFGYFLHHKKRNSPAYYGVSMAFRWLSRQRLCLKHLSGPSSQGRGGYQSPLSEHDQEVLNEFSNELGTILDKAFNLKPVRKYERHTIVFYVRVSLLGREVYYRKVLRITFRYIEGLIQRIPRVREAFKRSSLIENS